jgi:hypothetical protein
VSAPLGGTGQTSYTVGDILFADTGTSLAKLADVAVGNALISGGVAAAPSYGKIGLATHVDGTLPVANGGTGATTLTANNVLLGNGTSAVQFVAPGTSGNVLTSNGTTWTSAPVGGGFASGTLMLFQQTAAPTGWTKQTTHDNKALRVVSGTASSGGSVAFTTAFASQSVAGTVGGTTLSTSQIPSHTHTTQAGATAGTGFQGVTRGVPGDIFNTSSTGGGGSHNHTFTGTAINLAVSYVDLIIASKD